MEMRLRENPQKFSSGLLQLAARYLFVNGAQVRCIMLPLSQAQKIVHNNFNRNNISVTSFIVKWCSTVITLLFFIIHQTV